MAMTLSLVMMSVGFMPSVWAVSAEDREAAHKVTTLNEVLVRADIENPYKADSATTGSKMDVPLKDIPASVVVVPKQLLDDKVTYTMNEATKNVSGVTPVMAGGYGFANRYLIRGLSQRFLRDGLTDGPSMNGYFRTLWDVETLEVLKGPGSAVYGRGEPGGNVNVVTKKPTADRQTEIGVSGGSFGTYEVYGDFGGLFNSPAYPSRLIAGYQHSDGFRDLERDVWAVMPTVAWQPDDIQTWTVDYDFRHMEIVPDNYGIPFKNGTPIDVDHENKYYSPFNFAEQEIHRITVQHDWSENEAFSLKNAFVLDHRDLDMLRNASGAINAAGVFASRDARAQTDDLYDLSYQIEGTWKASTGDWNHIILGGFEYERIDVDTVRENASLGNITDPFNPMIPETSASSLVRVPNFDRNITSDTISFYGQDMIEITEQWKLRGGVRLDNVWYTDDGFSRFPSTASPYTYRLLDYEESLWSWQAGTVYQPQEWFSIYGGASSGRFINIQTESTTIAEVPEESFQLEAGIKADWIENRLTTNIAVFQTTRENYYVTPFGGGDTIPVGEQETTGVELDAVANLGAGWTVIGNFTVLDAEMTGDQLSGGINLKGRDPQSVPETMGSLWLQHAFQQPSLKGWGFGAGAVYQGTSYADALNANEVPDYWVGDLAVFYKLENQEFRLAVKNFTDEEYFTNATFSGALPGEPLNVNFSYKVRY